MSVWQLVLFGLFLLAVNISVFHHFLRKVMESTSGELQQHYLSLFLFVAVITSVSPVLLTWYNPTSIFHVYARVRCLYGFVVTSCPHLHLKLSGKYVDSAHWPCGIFGLWCNPWFRLSLWGWPWSLTWLLLICSRTTLHPRSKVSSSARTRGAGLLYRLQLLSIHGSDYPVRLWWAMHIIMCSIAYMVIGRCWVLFISFSLRE